MYTLEQLRGFVAVAEHLHFGRAAESLQMTQPPLSRQVQKLEADLGAVLFARTNRHVELTAAGVEMLERARLILNLSERSREAVRSIAHGERGSLRIGFTAVSALSVLGPVLEAITSALPDVDIDLQESVTASQLVGIDRGAIDLGLLRSAPDGEYGVREIHREPLVAAAPEGHALAQQERACTIDQLASHPMIGYAPSGSEYFRRKVELLFGGRELDVVYSVSQIASMLSLVHQGFGIAVVPESARLMRPSGVRFLDLHIPGYVAAGTEVSLSLAWSLQPRNPAVGRALDVLANIGSSDLAAP